MLERDDFVKFESKNVSARTDCDPDAETMPVIRRAIPGAPGVAGHQGPLAGRVPGGCAAREAAE